VNSLMYTQVYLKCAVTYDAPVAHFPERLRSMSSNGSCSTAQLIKSSRTMPALWESSVLSIFHGQKGVILMMGVQTST
jgi:hypothetical protein